MNRLAWIFVLALLPVVGINELEAQDYQVVVNASVPAGSLSKKEVSAFFMGTKGSWPGGQSVEAVDLVEGSSVRASFSDAVIGRAVEAVKAYWLKEIYSGRKVPPPEVGSDQEVLDFVKTHPGGIGYVAAGAAVPDGVKVLEIAG